MFYDTIHGFGFSVALLLSLKRSLYGRTLYNGYRKKGAPPPDFTSEHMIRSLAVCGGVYGGRYFPMTRYRNAPRPRRLASTGPCGALPVYLEYP